MQISPFTVRSSTRHIIPFKVMKVNKLVNHNDHRQMLQSNAEVIMAKQKLQLEKSFKCNFKPKTVKPKKINKLKPKVTKKK